MARAAAAGMQGVGIVPIDLHSACKLMLPVDFGSLQQVRCDINCSFNLAARHPFECPKQLFLPAMSEVARTDRVQQSQIHSPIKSKAEYSFDGIWVASFAGLAVIPPSLSNSLTHLRLDNNAIAALTGLQTLVFWFDILNFNFP